MKEVLLTVVCPLELEQTMIDYLLAFDEKLGFSTTRIYGHGHATKHLSLVEQVEGRKKEIQFQLHVSNEVCRKIIDSLKETYPHTAVHYWSTPLLESGDTRVD